MNIGDRVVLTQNETKSRLGSRRYGNVIEVGQGGRVRVKWEDVEYSRTDGHETPATKAYTLRTWCQVKRLAIVPAEVM